MGLDLADGFVGIFDMPSDRLEDQTVIFAGIRHRHATAQGQR